MVAYLARRIGAMLLILLGATFLIYNLTAISGDPLEDLRLSTEENAQYLIEQYTKDLQLDIPPPVRYFMWLQGVLGFLWGDFTLGVGLDGAPVLTSLSLAIPISIRLVITATILSIIIGISIGIVTALRQYSRFDYSVTFTAFLFYSLPIFWVAVLLKQFGAIGFNDWLMNPVIAPEWLFGLSLVSAIFWAGIIGGDKKRIAITGAVAFVSSGAVLYYISASGWLLTLGLGPVLITIMGFGVALGITQLSSGLSNRRVLAIALGMAVLTPVFYFVMQPVFTVEFDGAMMLLLAIATIGVGVGAGMLFGGDHRKAAARTAAIVAFINAGLIVLDRFMQSWPIYFNEVAYGRPIKTVGDSTLDLQADYWIMGIDTTVHLLLPTMALMLVSLAGYVRYSRASLLEVLNQDYIRTARAKGLNERTVIMRHAFRNSLIPLTTIMAFDFAGVLGGAIITEQVFAWRGMGTIFNQALGRVDLNGVMGVVLITSISALVFNLIADLIYSALDPRIRVTK
ncbi:MAG: ABC transporter permease [Actinobacteria bacterium]|nr:ABC transporter permease [Actinomycetota bacterium]